MKKIILIGIALLGFVINCSAQLLWKVSGNGIKEASYIFGTHHVAPLSICDSIVGFDNAFNSCKQLYGEIVMTDMEALEKEMIKYVMLPNDSLLNTLYSVEESIMIDSILKIHMGVGINELKSLKPLVIGVNLVVLINAKIFKDHNPNKQLDMMMQKRAKEKGMTVKGFETILYQTELIFGAPIGEQATALLKILENIDKMEEYSTNMANAYLQQDLDKLLKDITDPDLGSSKEEMNRLFFDRNRHWAKQAKTIFEKPTFIVVGAGHLPTDEGLINLLRKQGYSVIPVR